MQLSAALLANPIHSKQAAQDIAQYAAASPKHFAALMNCFLSNEYRMAQRAAWSVNLAVRMDHSLIEPYIPQLVQQLPRKDVHAAVVRNAARILEEIEIPDAHHGTVMNTCFELVTTPTTPAAIKAFSLTILHTLSLRYPDIQPELKVIIEEQWDTATAAFRSRGKKILAQLSKMASR